MSTTATYPLDTEDIELIREALADDLNRQLKWASEFAENAVSNSSVTELRDAESRLRDVTRIMALFTGPLGYPYTQYGRLVTLTRVERDALWRLIASELDTFADPLVSIEKKTADEAKQQRVWAELMFEMLDDLGWDEKPTLPSHVTGGGTFGISRSGRINRESLTAWLTDKREHQRAAFEYDAPYDESNPETRQQVARDREMLAALGAILERLAAGETGAPR